MSPSSLHAETLRLLKEADASTEEISRESRVSFYWLRKFRSGRVAEPSVNRVQRVYEFLAGRPLPL